MLAIDLVRFCGEMLKRLSECDILLDYYHVEPGTEDAAWLQGYLVRSIVKVMHNS